MVEYCENWASLHTAERQKLSKHYRFGGEDAGKHGDKPATQRQACGGTGINHQVQGLQQASESRRGGSGQNTEPTMSATCQRRPALLLLLISVHHHTQNGLAAPVFRQPGSAAHAAGVKTWKPAQHGHRHGF